MMKLTTKFIGEIDGNQIVAWRVGINRRGLLHIMDVPDVDTAAIAELIAIRHLLFVDKIFDREINTGIGIALDVSVPVVKKTARGKSSKQHLATLARYFSTNLSGITLGDTKRSDEFLPVPGDHVSETYISKNDETHYDVFHTPAMGDIKLTQHAVEKFTKHLHSGESKNPVVSLIKRLKHEAIELQALPDKVLKHKMRKYGSVDNLETWGHSSSQMHYTVTRDHQSGIGTVVTVFKRHPGL